MSSKATHDQVLAALRRVEDPEVPVNIVDLGLVQDIAIAEDGVRVTLAPTYAACPGRTYIAAQARSELETIVGRVDIVWSSEPAWRRQLIRPDAIRQMREFGVSVPSASPRVAECPFCGSRETRLENEFGSAVCKSLFYCESCRNPFEALRGAW